jgi:hypothetical protein
MTNFSPQAPYVSNAIYLPDDEDERIIRITEVLSSLANAVNARTIGTFQPTELANGNVYSFSSTSNALSGTFQKMIPVTLGNTNTVSVAHGIQKLLYCTTIRGFANDVVASTVPQSYPTTFIPLPQSAPDDVSITVDQTNVNVTTSTATYAGFQGFVIIEYVRN